MRSPRDDDRPGRRARTRAALAVGAVVALVSLVSWVSSPSVPEASEAVAVGAADGSPATITSHGVAFADARVAAFVQAYDALIDSVVASEDDIVFHFGSRLIHFQDGRMLDSGDPGRRDECDPIFYRYPLGRLVAVPPAPRSSDDRPTYCGDLAETLWGRTETEIRQHGRSTTFLGHRMFVNELVADALARVEPEVLAVADRDRSVRRWVSDLRITYSFIDRGIAGSENRSQHAWGMAVDFVPSSYRGRAVYWRWSRALDREGWYEIPLERRWSPPQPVIDVFEKHGFVWGGKWTHFDMIHFEYRPEIVLYARMAEDDVTPSAASR